VLEITCQDSDVTVERVGELRVIRAVDILAGIAVNIPMTALALAGLLTEAVSAVAA